MKKKVDIYSEEFQGKIGFVTFRGFIWVLKINWLGIVLMGAIAVGLIFIIDLLSSTILSVDFQLGLLIDMGFLWIYIIAAIMGILIGGRINTKLFYRNRRYNQDGDTELLGDIMITHRFVEAKSIRWHYIEAGPSKAEIIVFLHGVPESWYTWHYQIQDLAKEYHVYAFDLKGYGQSDKKIGDYRWEGVMDEFIAVLDKLGIKKCNYVCHDRGTVLIDYLGGTYPERVLRFVRGQQVLIKWTPVRSPQEKLYIHPIRGTRANENPRMIIPHAYARWYYFSKNKISKKDMKRAIYEYSYPKISWAVPRYFRSNGFAKEVEDRKNYLLKNMNFPVLLLEAGSDPFQPRYYYEGAIELFPNAELKFIEGAGHFWAYEKPGEVTEIIKEFFKNNPVN